MYNNTEFGQSYEAELKIQPRCYW